MTALSFLCVFGLFSASPASVQQGSPTAEVQADTFAKIFPFDRRLGDLASVDVLLLRPDPVGGWGPTLAELETSFNAGGMAARQLGLAELAAALSPTTVVYLVAETATDEVLAAIAEAGALSISGFHELAEAGQVSVALDARGARPEIVVNLPRVERERHEFSAQLLRVARIVRGTPAGTPGITRGPRLVQMDEPQYTPMARRMRIQGEVVVRILVSETGQVEEVELVRGIAQNVGLNEAALEAARSATFEPALENGRPVSEWYTRSFRFMN